MYSRIASGRLPSAWQIDSQVDPEFWAILVIKAQTRTSLALALVVDMSVDVRWRTLLGSGGQVWALFLPRLLQSGS